MKKIISTLTLFCLVNVAAIAQTTPTPQQKKDIAGGTTKPPSATCGKGPCDPDAPAAAAN